MKVKLHPRWFVFLLSFFFPYLAHAQVDLGVLQTVSSTISAGRNLTYSILVVNNGPGGATSVNLTGNLPTGTTFVSFTAPADWTVAAPATGINAPVLATIPSLPSGTIQTFTLVVNVGSNIPVGTILTSTAIVSGILTDSDPTNNLAGASTAVAVLPTFDFGINSRTFPTVNVGGNIIYLIQLANPAIGLPLGVSFADIPPSGTSFVSLTTPAGWTTTTPQVGSNGIITAAASLLLAPGTATTFVLLLRTATNAAGTLISNAAAVTSLTTDMNQNNNFTVLSTRVVSPTPAEISVIKSGPATVSPGSNITYTITVRNNSNANAENVSLTDGLSSGSTFISLLAAPGWTVTAPAPGLPGLITATTPLMAGGAFATFTLTVRTADNLSGNLTNVASVSSGNFDPDNSNNSSGTTATFATGACSITCPNNIIVTNTPGQCGAIVNFPFPVISGNCGSVTAVPASGSFFPIGTTTVKITTGSGATCSFNVRVNETQAPVITSCPTLAPICGNSTGVYTIPRLVANDNCSAVIINYAISGATNRTGSGDNASGSFNIGTSTILWTVRDSSNNITNCQTKVTVNDPVAANISDASALISGVNINTVYPGYAPAAKITLTVKASGGTPPYSYSWSNGATTASINVSPATATTYRVTVTDSFGCKQVSAEKLVKVEDVTCGPKGSKVQVCVVPPGNFGLSYNSCADPGAVPALLKVGSHLGSCSTMEDFTLSIKAIPNPTSSYFTLDITSGNLKDKVTLNIYNITGRLVESKMVNANSKVQIGASYYSGTYLAEAVQGTKKATLVIIKIK